MKIINKIYMKFVNHTSNSRIRYLRKKGCKIGDRTILLCGIGDFGTEPYLIEVGNDCLFSAPVSFFTHDGGVSVLNNLDYFNGKKMDKIGKIKIGNNCFIGSGAKILPGVNIGDNVIIGAGSVVSKSIPSNSVVAGVPAKVICSIDDYCKKNQDRFYETYGMDSNKKREYLLDALLQE